jgi:lipid-A-disaccharide synthase
VSEPRKTEVLLVAAEASSELYARRIIEEVKKRGLDFNFYGIGSHSMKAMGFDLIESSENMAVVGLFEVLAHWKVISRAFKSLVRRASGLQTGEKPKVALLIDYPDFNLRLAKKLNSRKIPVLYFISPQVWAWRQGRVHLIKKIVSRMLVVFPFEKDFYEKFNVPVSFVGHPLLDEIKNLRFQGEDRKVARQHLGVKDGDFLVGLLPGSRESELKYNFQTQLNAATEIAVKKPFARFIILVAPTLDIERVKSLIPENLKVSLRVVKDDPLKIIQICDACIVASGTATLMVGLAEVPMVIMYKMNQATGFVARRLVSGAFFGMANLILGERAVPELFQDEANPENLSKEICRYIDDNDYRIATTQKLSKIKDRLGSGGAISRVVDELVKVLT